MTVAKSGASAFQLASVRLYQPDEVLAARLPGGTAELGGYIQCLAWVCSEYIRLLNQDMGSFGLLIAVGIRPEGRVRLWCEQVDGALPPDHWAQLVELLDGAGRNTLPQVRGPVALAIEGAIGQGPSNGFPEVPSTWAEAARTLAAPTTLPDGLFDVVFP